MGSLEALLKAAFPPEASVPEQVLIWVWPKTSNGSAFWTLLF